jgi:hypothetical protein
LPVTWLVKGGGLRVYAVTLLLSQVVGKCPPPR